MKAVPKIVGGVKTRYQEWATVCYTKGVMTTIIYNKKVVSKRYDGHSHHSVRKLALTIPSKSKYPYSQKQIYMPRYSHDNANPNKSQGQTPF